MPGRCLGRRPAKKDPRTLNFAKYASALPKPPTSVAWSQHTPSWPMMLNDDIGDCTYAAAGHMVQAWTAYVLGAPGTIIPDAAILAGYEAVSGYKPGDPDTDTGAVELDVLNYWRTTGIGGHKIDAFAAVPPKNTTLVKQATYLFGGLYLGLALPEAASGQIDAGKPWTLDTLLKVGEWEPGSWGGHAVPIVAYDSYWITVVTWGQLQGMSWNFFNAYCDEAWAVLSGSDWLGGSPARSPSGFDMAALQADLQAVTG